MCNILVEGSLDITISGNSFGFTCPWQTNITCCSEPGTYAVFFENGGIGICPPGRPYWDPSITYWDICGLNKSTTGKYTQVFCDPCLDRCNKDGSVMRYTGNQQWLFTTYVNASPEPRPLILTTFSVSNECCKNGCGSFDSKLSVNGTECCCGDVDEFGQSVTYTVYVPEVSKDIKELLQAMPQPYISTGGDPQEACACGCPGAGCGPNLYGVCGGITELLQAWREAEVEYNCKAAGGLF
jgi:hypothetical protein